MKNKLTAKQFYLLSFTWGLPLTLAGCIVAGVLILFGKRPKKWGYSYYFEIGRNWGGAAIGFFFITGKYATERLKNHEFGHGIQNCYYGFIMPVLVNLPSTLRFWYRTIFKISSPPYDSIWFEGQATRLGCLYNEKTEV